MVHKDFTIVSDDGTKQLFVVVLDNCIAMNLHDCESFHLLDFFELSLDLLDKVFGVKSFDELFVIANNNDRSQIRYQILPVANTDNKVTGSDATGGDTSSGVVTSEGEALSTEVDVKLTEAEINALLILVNTELDSTDRIFESNELNAIRNKLLDASSIFDLPCLLW